MLTELYEETDRGRASRASVRPEDHVVLIGIVSAFEEIEEQMSRLNVDVSGVGPLTVQFDLLNQCQAESRCPYLTDLSQKSDFLMRTL